MMGVPHRRPPRACELQWAGGGVHCRWAAGTSTSHRRLTTAHINSAVIQVWCWDLWLLEFCFDKVMVFGIGGNEARAKLGRTLYQKWCPLWYTDLAEIFACNRACAHTTDACVFAAWPGSKPWCTHTCIEGFPVNKIRSVGSRMQPDKTFTNDANQIFVLGEGSQMVHRDISDEHETCEHTRRVSRGGRL
jgi:hypothetical protein